jgi:hypothetical protein
MDIPFVFVQKYSAFDEIWNFRPLLYERNLTVVRNRQMDFQFT